MVEAPLFVEKMMEKIQLLLRWRKSSEIFAYILIQISNLDYCIFGPFAKVDTSFRSSTLKTQNNR